MPKERPILFSPPMVRALREGRKTQTRRIVTARNSTIDGWMFKGSLEWDRMDWKNATARDKATIMVALVGRDKAPEDIHIRVPHLTDGTFHRVRPKIEPGDVLWVREATIVIPTGPTLVGYVADGCTKTERFEKLRPGIHMLRGHCRLRVEVVNVRVERVQDISEADAIAEGLPYADGNREYYLWEGRGYHGAGFDRYGGMTFHTPAHDKSGRCGCMVGLSSPAVCAYAELWDSINGKGSWAKNPWVWTVEFRTIP